MSAWLMHHHTPDRWHVAAAWDGRTTGEDGGHPFPGTRDDRPAVQHHDTGQRFSPSTGGELVGDRLRRHAAVGQLPSGQNMRLLYGEGTELVVPVQDVGAAGHGATVTHRATPWRTGLDVCGRRGVRKTLWIPGVSTTTTYRAARC
jgi:hypothetical protein